MEGACEARWTVVRVPGFVPHALHSHFSFPHAAVSEVSIDEVSPHFPVKGRKARNEHQAMRKLTAKHFLLCIGLRLEPGPLGMKDSHHFQPSKPRQRAACLSKAEVSLTWKCEL